MKRRLLITMAFGMGMAAVLHPWKPLMRRHWQSLPLEQRLRSHVEALADRIGERHPGVPAKLDEAARYVEASFRASGYTTVSDEFSAQGQRLRNLVAVRDGSEPAIVVGAHYDSVAHSPGADDNASGTSVLLEVAALARRWPAGRKVYFVAFSNEEAVRANDMGSYRFARRSHAEGVRFSQMICLEMVGYYDSRRGSQRYPAGLGLFYPSKGNFVALVSNVRSWPLLRALRRPLRQLNTLPFTSTVLPSFIGGIDRSDHMNFWRIGVPAVMITDTAFYRNPHYHLPSDSARRLDYRRMAELTLSLDRALQNLASAP